LKPTVLQDHVHVTEHYAGHLAAVYLWMAGGLDAAMARGQAEIDALCQVHGDGLVAVDLGAGFGMHAIPLARCGYSVCFLEFGDDSVTVHGMLHERSGETWRQRISAYRKLRLPTDWVVKALQARGLSVRSEPGADADQRQRLSCNHHRLNIGIPT
jgi:hypothetical protein